MEKKLFIVNNKTDLERCYPVMKELRPHLTPQDFFSIYDQSHSADGYEIVAIEIQGEIKAVMGLRFLTDFVRGKHVYIDDLISSHSVRSMGLGAELLKFAESIAKENNCASLRLCTGIENERGMQFYEKNDWKKRAYAYTKKLKL